jgi:hypothetical protein
MLPSTCAWTSDEGVSFTQTAFQGDPGRKGGAIVSESGKKPTLTIVAGREGPAEGAYSNAARIADVKAKTPAPQKRKRGRPRKNQDKDLMANKAPLDEETAQRMEKNSELCLQMEGPIRDAALMAGIVLGLIIEADEDEDWNEQTVWAVDRLCDMVRDLRGLYRGKPAGEDGTAT